MKKIINILLILSLCVSPVLSAKSKDSSAWFPEIDFTYLKIAGTLFAALGTAVALSKYMNSAPKPVLEGDDLPAPKNDSNGGGGEGGGSLVASVVLAASTTAAGVIPDRNSAKRVLEEAAVEEVEAADYTPDDTRLRIPPPASGRFTVRDSIVVAPQRDSVQAGDQIVYRLDEGERVLNVGEVFRGEVRNRRGEILRQSDLNGIRARRSFQILVCGNHNIQLGVKKKGRSEIDWVKKPFEIHIYAS